MGIKDEVVYKAKLAEQAERYDEMAEFMKQVCIEAHKASPPQDLTVEERNLLSVAYKNAVGARRASWRIISSVEQKETSKGNTENAETAASFRQKVEVELGKICGEIINIINEYTLKDKSAATDSAAAESQVFYYKMMGDYHRYVAEFSNGDAKASAADKAKLAYQDAQTSAESLPVTHPIRLGLALNFSVFHYEVLSNPEEACQMARTAFEDAIAELDNVAEETYKDSTLIMQLLRDNLTLWTSDQGDAEADGQ